MTPLMAAALCVVAVLYFFYREAKESPDASGALWLPLLWMFLAGSRYVSSWMNLSGGSSDTLYDEGSPMDAAVFGVLIIAGLVILSRRRINWSQFAWDNKLVVGYLLFCLISITWSDAPAIGARRWIKDLGNPIMALVILTEAQPLMAFGVVLRRLAYLLLPFSVLFVRYYPEWGRTYHFGVPLFTGVGHQKNALGQMCLITGIYFAWQVLVDSKTFKSWDRGRRLRLWLLAGMLVYLLDLSDSQTSLVTLLVAVGILASSQLGFVRRQPTRLLALMLNVALFGLVLDSTLDVRKLLYELIGRNPSLTNRTELWAILFNVSTEPVLGAGFMSFWSGERLLEVWALLGAAVLQAHSGYIEQYLNLGYVGVAFVLMLLAAGLLDARAHARTDPAFSALRVAVLIAVAVYNYTEASFYGINNVWLLCLFCLMTAPRPTADSIVEPHASDAPLTELRMDSLRDHPSTEK
jgi:exopolysaccharide production protein ExoQ